MPIPGKMVPDETVLIGHMNCITSPSEERLTPGPRWPWGGYAATFCPYNCCFTFMTRFRNSALVSI